MELFLNNLDALLSVVNAQTVIFHFLEDNGASKASVGCFLGNI
jgi:hypothetical protein